MISEENVKRLLNAEEGAVLVFLEGRADVVSGRQLDSEQYRGALQVIDWEDLVERIGANPSEHELTEIAAQLDSQVSEMGA